MKQTWLKCAGGWCGELWQAWLAKAGHGWPWHLVNLRLYSETMRSYHTWPGPRLAIAGLAGHGLHWPTMAHGQLASKIKVKTTRSSLGPPMAGHGGFS